MYYPQRVIQEPILRKTLKHPDAYFHLYMCLYHYRKESIDGNWFEIFLPNEEAEIQKIEKEKNRDGSIRFRYLGLYNRMGIFNALCGNDLSLSMSYRAMITMHENNPTYNDEYFVNSMTFIMGRCRSQQIRDEQDIYELGNYEYEVDENGKIL